MQVVGKLIKKEDLKSGVGKESGKQWSMIKFVIAQKGFKEPTELDMTAFNSETVQFISDTSIGTNLIADIVVESKTKEWNGKQWRGTEVKCLRAEVTKDDGMEVKDHRGTSQMAQMHNQQYQRATTPPDEEDTGLPF